MIQFVCGSRKRYSVASFYGFNSFLYLVYVRKKIIIKTHFSWLRNCIDEKISNFVFPYLLFLEGEISLLALVATEFSL